MEYKVVSRRFGGLFADRDVAWFLNSQADEGWRFVGITPDGQFIFERPKETRQVRRCPRRVAGD